MPNIGTVLREEIARLSRKEVRSHVDPTKKATGLQRRDIALLKRQVAELARQVARLARRLPDGNPAGPPGSTAKPMRFSAKGLQAQRRRLGLSASDFGKLVGVSAQTIYNWEHEEARPRGAQRAKLAAVRGMGKREARKRLEQ